MDQLKNYYKEMGVDEKVFDRTVKPDQGIKCDAETSDRGNASGWHNRIWIQ